MLAGTVAGPEVYNPRKHLDKALGRRAFVLEQMHEKGFLSDAQYELAKDEPVKLAPPVTRRGAARARGRRDRAAGCSRSSSARARRAAGYTITTSIDPKLQAAARKALRDASAPTTRGTAALGAVQGAAAAHRRQEGPHRQAAAAQGAAVRRARRVRAPQGARRRGRGRGRREGHARRARRARCTGSVRLCDYARYNPQKPPPERSSRRKGALVRVSLLGPGRRSKLAPCAERAPPQQVRVPLRLESGPEGAMVAIDVRTREIEALVGSYEAADRRARSRDAGAGANPARRSSPSSTRTRSTRAASRPRRSSIRSRTSSPAAITRRTTRATRARIRCACARRSRTPSTSSPCACSLDVGRRERRAWAQSLGIESTLKPDLSLALGSYEVEPMELAGAYATFAAGGMYEEPRLVTKIVGPDGKERRAPAAAAAAPRARRGRGVRHDEHAHERRRSRHRRAREVARSPARGQDRHEQRVEGHVVRGLLARDRARSCGSVTTTASRSAAERRARRSRCPRGSIS